MAGVAKAGVDWQFKTLYKLLAELSHATALQDVYDAALASLMDATAADRAAILLFDDDGVIRFKASRNLSPEYQAAVTGHCPWLKGTRDAQPLVIADVLLDQNLAKFLGHFERERIRALTFIPLSLSAGVIGKFMLYYPEPHEKVQEEVEIASAIAAHIALATEHKWAEMARKKLEAAAQHLAAIVESSEDAIVSKDLNGIITSWNKGAERMFGYTAAEAVGQPVAMLAAPERLDEMPVILSKIREGERVGHYETRRRRKDGQIVDVALTVSPVYDSSGRIIGASKIARDITEIKRAERERAELLAREREAHRTAELLNQVAPRFAAQLDLQRLVQEVTDIATALVGAQFGSFIHKAVNEKGEGYVLHALSGSARAAFAGVPSWDSTPFFDPMYCGHSIVRSDDVTKDPGYGQNPLDLDMPEGRQPVRSYLAAPVVSRSGEVLGGLFFGHSLPEVFTSAHEAIIAGIAAQAAIAIDNARLFEQAQWAHAELKRSNEDLRRANRDLEFFAYSASHDLQEPLRTIAISAQFIQRSSGDTLLGDSAKLLTNILAASKRMTTLIQDLLTYTKATRYEEGPAPNVQPRDILNDVLLAMRAPIEESRALIATSELPSVAIHPSRLALVLQNLLSNAIKYRGSDAPRVRISAEERDGWCVFSVTDNGIGLDPKYGEQIFVLFKRLHKKDEYPGSGIGLAICQRVVEQYGGRIWLETSAPGRGSTFSFSLPCGTSVNEQNALKASTAASEGD
jgi:PAS domain S-box-containing protein